MGLNFKFVSSGQSVDGAVVVTQTIRGRSLLPPAPVHLRGSRNAAGDLLIEWTRRERIAFPLRDYAGTPISEENEIYVIEIYSGSTLKRTIRDPRVTTAKTLRWFALTGDSGFITINANGSLSCSAGPPIEAGTVVSSDTFMGDFTLEFVRASNRPPTTFGIAPVSTPADGYPHSTSRLLTAKYPYFSTTDTTVLPMGNSSYQTTSAAADRFTIERQGSIVRFFKNAHSSSVRIPLYETTFASSEKFRAYVEFENGDGFVHDLDPSGIGLVTSRAYHYMANQQVDDFGSIQSSIKVRVSQESAIVGKGAYLERDL